MDREGEREEETDRERQLIWQRAQYISRALSHLSWLHFPQSFSQKSRPSAAQLVNISWRMAISLLSLSSTPDQSSEMLRLTTVRTVGLRPMSKHSNHMAGRTDPLSQQRSVSHFCDTKTFQFRHVSLYRFSTSKHVIYTLA